MACLGSVPFSAFSSPSSEALRACGITPSRQPWVALLTGVLCSCLTATSNCGYCLRHATSTGSLRAPLEVGK